MKNIVVVNRSRKRKATQVRRLLSPVLFEVDMRHHIGCLPSRSIVELFRRLRAISSRGMNVTILVEEKKTGSHGWKAIEVGKKEAQWALMTGSESSIDKLLLREKLVEPFFGAD